jgi:acetyl-CoA carboxylase carboxyltransferase component
MTKSAMRGVPVTLQDAATTGNGTAIMVPSSFKYHQFLIKGVATISAGKIMLEGADATDYAGTWAALAAEQTIIAGELIVQVVGVLRAIRARISTNVTGAGGSVSVEYTGS